MYDYVFFDLDGTLSDSFEGVSKGIQIALKSVGIEEDRSNMRKCMGPPIGYSFKTFWHLSDEEVEKATAAYREYYNKIGLFENTPYEGIKDVLIKIKESGRKLAVTTSKPEKFTIPILDKFGMNGIFDVIAAATLDGKRTTKTDVLEYALEAFGNPDKSKVVLIGDTKFDAEGAKNVGIDCIGVLYGFGTKESLLEAGVKDIAPTVQEIYNHI
ncbi:MAG: HAD hydrolase-like protein [Lachnospiraceae bacterium]|nr:HAD hydrolase-like protein [Lachnospiraceae bacterium]